MLLFYTAFSEEIMDRLEIYVNEEMLHRSEHFKKELKRCFKVAEKYAKRPDIEKQLKREKCDTVFKEYEQLVEKATEKYQSEIDRDYREILERYRKNLLSYRKENLTLEVKNFRFGKDRYRFIFIKKPVDVDKIWVEKRDKKLPYCTTEDGYVFFLQENDGKQSRLTVFIKEEDGIVEQIEYTAEGSFKPFRVEIRENTVILPLPVYGGYMVYGSIRKELPRFKTEENPCTLSRVEVESSPEKVFVGLPYEGKGIKGTKSYKVY